MKPIPLEMIAFARITKRERICTVPQYRIYIRGVPGEFGAGYTDVVVAKIKRRGWYLLERRGGAAIVPGPEIEPGMHLVAYHPTRAAAASELHLCEEYIPENVRRYLAEVLP